MQRLAFLSPPAHAVCNNEAEPGLTVYKIKIHTFLSSWICHDISKLRLNPSSAEYKGLKDTIHNLVHAEKWNIFLSLEAQHSLL